MIRRFYVTEKTSQLSQGNCYVFLVDQMVNKVMLKQMIFNMYDVNVLKVNTLKKVKKKIKRGRIQGFSKSLKKAYVFTDKPIELSQVTTNA